MDAVLGALALGDIGRHFPDTDHRYKGVNSLFLLDKVYLLMEEKGYRIGNLDVTVIAQQPKLAPYIDEMRRKVSDVLRVSVEEVNIKATTEEHLGFSGREEGIRAHSVVLLAEKERT
ncbi:MAG TPA: 2-C-methyl-D-erythritol 2,4-cyclodiphosphate synthase, partial [Eubacteriaceae bacterium]|nr:2-C-methyl-D-erythritol 2,4-cyclodiphosphate synthase [Eubacteriaceae bacterium]